MKVSKCIFSYFKKHVLILIGTFLLILLATLLALLPPQLLKIIVDEIIPNKNYDLIFYYALFYMLLFIASGIVDFIKEVFLVVISQGIGKKIRLEMLSKVHRLSYKMFTKYDTGSLESYFSNDVEEINALITSGVISMITDGFKMIGIIISIFIFSYLLGLFTLATLPLIVLFTLFVRKRMFNAQSTNRKLEGSVNNMVLESMDNIITIKAFRIYKSIQEKYNRLLWNHFKTNQKANNYDSMFSPIIQFLKTTLIVFIIILSTFFNSKLGISVGVLVAFIDLIGSLFSPIENIGMELQTIQKSLAAIDRINEFFQLEEEEKPVHSKKIENGETIVLEFNNVSYRYDQEEVIEDFNLIVNSNERIVLKGKSGSGKSTLFKLSYGLIKPTKGRVTINGMDTYLLTNEERRKYFGIVYQDYFFSGGSIKEEVTLLDKTVPDEKVVEILSLVGLSRIQDINQPFRLTDYSTGELSMFNIARAIIKDSKILFLDEMNANIDSINASQIMKIIDQVSKDKMVLSISHYGENLPNSQIITLS